MAFSRFAAAPTRISYADAVKAWVKLRKDGLRTLCVTVSGLLASNFAALGDEHVLGDTADGWCEVFLGDGEDEGQIEFLFGFGAQASEEAIRPGAGVHGLRRFTMVAPPGVPGEGSFAAEVCAVVARSEVDSTLRLKLPLAAWAAQGGSRSPAVAPVTQLGRRAPKIDAAGYLKKKLALDIACDGAGEVRI